MSRTCTYGVFVEQIHQISFRACYIIVVILQRWVSVVVKIAGLLQWEQTGCIPSTTPLPSHLCPPLLDLNLCRRFNAGTKPAEPTLKLRGLTLLVPTTSTWELWICWTHLQPNRGPPSNPVAGTCTSSGKPSSSLKISSKETMNRRQFQAQPASSLILVNMALQTPKRGRPSSGKVSPATVTSGSSLTPQKRPSKRSAHLPLDVRKDLVAHFPVKTGRGSCRHCIKGYTNMQCSKCDVHLCFSEDKNCFWDFHYE